MVTRLALVLLFLYSTPILSAADPVPGEPEAAGERLIDRKSTRLNSSHIQKPRMPSSA